MKKLLIVAIGVSLTLSFGMYAGTGLQIKNGKVIAVSRGLSAEEQDQPGARVIEDIIPTKADIPATTDIIPAPLILSLSKDEPGSRIGTPRAQVETLLIPAAPAAAPAAPVSTISFGSDVFVNERNFYLGASAGANEKENEPYALSRAGIVEGVPFITPLAP